MALQGTASSLVTYQDVTHITDDQNYPSTTYLIFNGSDTRGEIPISLKDKTNWEIEIRFTSDETGSNSAIYREPCIIGVDTGGYVSRDMHVDIMGGYLHLFSGLGGSNNVSDLPAGSTLNTGGGDYGYKTPKYISDGKLHIIKVYLKDSKLGLIADDEDLGALTVTNTLGSAANKIYIGSSFPSECVYGKFNLFYLKITVDGIVQGEYDLKTTDTDYIIDVSGNSKNIPLYGTRKYATTADKIYIDYSLPEGAAGRASTFVTHHPYQGLHLAPLQVFFTYKQDDKINLWEGTDSAIKGFASATVNYRPHDGVDVTPQAMLVNYRKHDGVDINKVLPFYLQRLEDGSTIYTVPNGIGGLIQPFITQRIVQSCSYLNDIDMGRVQGIAIQNAYFPLKGIKAMNGVPILNNNTTDQ